MPCQGSFSGHQSGISEADNADGEQFGYDRTESTILVRLPGSPDGAKVGLDDYLLAYGAEAFKSLLKEAQHPSTRNTTHVISSDCGASLLKAATSARGWSMVASASLRIL